MIGIGSKFTNGINNLFYYEENCMNSCFLGNGSIGNTYIYDFTYNLLRTHYNVFCTGYGYCRTEEEGFDHNLIFYV